MTTFFKLNKRFLSSFRPASSYFTSLEEMEKANNFVVYNHKLKELSTNELLHVRDLVVEFYAYLFLRLNRNGNAYWNRQIAMQSITSVIDNILYNKAA